MMYSKNDARKRLMFIQKEDYNFLTYNLLLLLKYYGAVSKESKFQDFKKISYLINFISKDSNFDNYNKYELARIYSKSHLKKQLLSHIVLVLKNKQYIGVDINYVRNSLDIWLIEENIPEDFLNSILFEKEIENIKYLRSELPLLKSIKLITLLNEIFTKNNVKIWEV